MKKLLLGAALGCLALGLAAPAEARNTGLVFSETVRNAQIQLSSLGYMTGRLDGLMGPRTTAALSEFQRVNGLPITGELTADTMNLLLRTNYAYYRGDNLYQPLDVHSNLASWPLNWDTRWRAVRTQTIPTRFAKLDINEDMRGGIRNYTVTLNGKAVLFADNQPGVMRVSRTLSMAGEDAVIMTAYHGEDGCSYRNYLLTVRADGTFVGPKLIGNCAGGYEANVANNALFINFPNSYDRSWGASDVWRYENANLIRL